MNQIQQSNMNQSGSVFIETYGCQMNLLDSEIVISMLEERGFSRADQIESASIILINTCAVREHAQEKAITNISKFRKYKQENSQVQIGVIGCLSKYLGETLVQRLPFLDWVLGPDAYRALPELINNGRSSRTILMLEGPDEELYDEILPSRREGVNAWVTISRGCDNHCTYCVVPGARGGERHRPMHSIHEEIVQSVAAGFPQVTLLGQNVNSYNWEGNRFPELLKSLTDIKGLERIRFLTSHPKDCSEKLLEIIGSGHPFCPELHLPVQAGNDDVLKRMGRKYTNSQYRDLVSMAREMVPDLYLSTDIIVGFPGETEEQFADTETLAEQIRYDDAYIYRYSHRPGTPSSKLDDDVANEEKVRRLMVINNIVRQSGELNRIKMIGKDVEVMIEGPSKKDTKEAMGKTRNGYIVVVPGIYEVGSQFTVRIQRLSGFTLRAKAFEAS